MGRKEGGESGRCGKKKGKVKVKESTDVEYIETESSDRVSSRGKKSGISNHEVEEGEGYVDVSSERNDEYMKKGKSEKRKKRNENGDNCEEIRIEKSCAEAHSSSRNFKKRDGKQKVIDVGIGEGRKKRKRWTRLVTNSENTKDKIGYEKENHGKSLVLGKRFSKQEDQMVKDAVYNYIEAHNLGEKGLDMILNCKKNSNVKNCWRDIAAALPWRPYLAVYKRAHLLFERAESRNWTEDEKAYILKFHDKHGPDYKTMAVVLAKNRNNVRDTWRRIRLSGRRTGNWTQAEYQILFDLVNKDLRMRVYEERNSKHGLLRDNIGWQAISNTVATRTDVSCCYQWYTKLSSSMVKDGVWADVDDYRLLNELFMLDACCVDDVDWDNLLEYRSGEICQKRWRQMVNHIGEHGIKSFMQQVEVLAKRYCPELLETREAFDSRPFIS